MTEPPPPAWRVGPLRVVGMFGSALRIPLRVVAGMALFSIIRLQLIPS